MRNTGSTLECMRVRPQALLPSACPSPGPECLGWPRKAGCHTSYHTAGCNFHYGLTIRGAPLLAITPVHPSYSMLPAHVRHTDNCCSCLPFRPHLRACPPTCPPNTRTAHFPAPTACKGATCQHASRALPLRPPRPNQPLSRSLQQCPVRPPFSLPRLAALLLHSERLAKTSYGYRPRPSGAWSGEPKGAFERQRSMPWFRTRLSCLPLSSHRKPLRR